MLIAYLAAMCEIIYLGYFNQEELLNYIVGIKARLHTDLSSKIHKNSQKLVKLVKLN